eukprot:Em0002g666a
MDSERSNESDRSDGSDESDLSDSYDDLSDLEPLPKRGRQSTHSDNLSGVEERNSDIALSPDRQIEEHGAEKLQSMQQTPAGELKGGFGTSKPLLKDLACLKVTPAKWYRLGLQLNISENELDKIKANNSTDVDSCILEMFKTWLRNTPDATYAELKDALDRIGEHSVAAQLLQPSVVKVQDFMKEDECTRAMMNGNLEIIKRMKRPIEIEKIGRFEDGTLASCIIVQGIPGVGKSTLAWQLGRRWGKKEILQHFQLVIVLRLRDERVQKAHTISELLYHPDPDIQQSVSKWMASTLGGDVLLILDGYDELSSELQIGDHSIFARIIKGEEFPKLTVLVTSRPSANRNLYQLCRIRAKCQYIEVVGFSKKEIREYIELAFEHNLQLKESFNLYIEQRPHIHSMMYVPINCAIVVELFREHKGKPPQTLTEVYTALTNTLLQRHEKKTKEKTSVDMTHTAVTSSKMTCFEGLSSTTLSQLQSVARLAYQGTLNDQLIFHDVQDNIESLGLLQKVPQLYSTSSPKASYNFIHKTLQEFLTAWYVSSLPTSEQRVFVEDSFTEPNMAMTVRFMAGLTKFQTSSENMDDLANIVISLDTTDEQRLIENLHWMFETQNPTFIQRLLGNKELIFECSGTLLNPFDLHVLGYCIANSSSLWSVNLKYCDESMRILFLVEDGKAFDHITSFNLSGSKITASVASLLGMMLKENNTLKELNLVDCKLQPEGLEEVIKGVQVHTKLENLVLSVNTIDNKRASCLGMMLKVNNTLKKLKLDRCGLQPEGLEEVIKGVQVNTMLETLVLSQNTLDNERASCLGMMLKENNTLKKLNLRKCKLQPEGLELVIKGVQVNTKLETLDLSWSTIDNKGVSCLAHVLKHNTTLSELELRGCGLRDEAICELCGGLKWCKLKKLDLGANPIGDQGAKGLADMLKDHPKLEELEVDGCPMISDDAHALKHNTTLSKLRLWRCGLRDEAICELCGGLKWCKLKKLNLCNNTFGDQGAKGLADMLRDHPTLEELDVYGCEEISDDGVQYLMDAMMSNTRVKMLKLDEKYKHLIVPQELVGRIIYSPY